MIKRTDKTYPNGLRHIHIYLPFMKSLFMTFFIKAGSTYEIKKEQWGAAHFLEHMVFNGSQKYPTSEEVKVATAKLGIDENASTWSDRTQYEMVLNKSVLAEAFDILLDRVYFPLLNEADVAKEKGIILEERKRADNNPIRQLYARSSDRLHAGTTYRHEILGTMDTIAGMTKEILTDYHNSFYNASNTTFITYGGVSYEEIESVISAGLERIPVFVSAQPSKQSALEVADSTEQIVEMPSESAYFLLDGKTDLPKDITQYATLLVLNAMWGGSNSSILRKALEVDNPLAFSLSSDIYLSGSYTHFEVSCGLESKNIDKLTNEVKSLNDNLKSLLTKELLESSRNYTLGKITRALEQIDMPRSIDPTNTLLVEIFTGFEVNQEQLRELITNVSHDQIIEMWESLMTNGDSVTTYLLPKK